MEIVKNQKGINQLVIDDQIWNEIISPDNKVIVAYGSNGRGKSTIKDLFQQENLSKNFDLGNEAQLNLFNTTFGQSKFLVYDENFVDNFVYSGDGLKRNQMKVILKTEEINNIINNKKAMNETITSIVVEGYNYISKIGAIEKVLNIKTSGAISTAQKRFATTFIVGNLPHRYEDIVNVNDPSHKSWWFEGLGIYKRNSLSTCPWCNTDYNAFAENIKSQINNVEQAGEIEPKLFSDKLSKTNELQSLATDYSLSADTIEKINELIPKINDSVESNNEQEIIDIMKNLRSSLDNDRSIFEEIVSKVKHIDNVLSVEITDLINRMNSLTFFSLDDETITELSEKVDTFINDNQQLVENIKISNQELIESIGSSEEEINSLLQNLGLKYEIEIDRNKVLSNGITDNDDYIVLKSLTGVDISSSVSTTLSYGEKSTLAFAIFIQQIRHLSDNDTIIIFDDPISSYDIFRRYTTINVLNTLREIDYQKIVILTHESNFLISIISNVKHETVRKLLLNEKSATQIEMVDIDINYSGEIDLYKQMIDGTNPNIHLCQSALALRQLHDIYTTITGFPKLSFYNYVCKLVHYRKDEAIAWDNSYIVDLNKIYNYFGITYNPNIEQIQNESIVFNDIDSLLTEIMSKDIYDINLEDLCSFRMISEAAVRNESADPNRFKKSKLSLWSITDSSKKIGLDNYKVLLNSISHIDDDEVAWTSLCIEDLKAIPRFVISQIIDVLR